MSESIFVTNNSKEVIDGAIFVAISGSKFDGHNHIKEAIEHGASYIVSEKYPEELGFSNAVLLSEYVDGAPTIASFEIVESGKKVIFDVVANSRLAYSMWAKESFPNQPEHLVAITGTNGKTSTAWFYQQILSIIGQNSASIGTLGVITNLDFSLSSKSTLTTPDAMELNKTLNAMHAIGINYCAMEASSIALEQKRMNGLVVEAAAFTNFSQDHLDYHKNMSSYFTSKTTLFNEILKPGKTAVLNECIPEFQKLKDICLNRSHNIITYGTKNSDIFIQNLNDKKVKIKIYTAEYTTDYNIAGSFQKENLMAAIGLAIASAIPQEQIISTIPKLKAPIGRIELVTQHNGADIFVDYAHTPDALQRALETIKEGLNGKLHLVFGCGGDRDQQKRSIMGGIASKYADYIIITDDNPRFEDPESIRNQILSCCNGISIGDRLTAIHHAMDKLKNGDALLIAGKGHEQYQIIKDKTLPFSDQKEVLKYAGERNE